jgi:adenylate cyclase class 2
MIEVEFKAKIENYEKFIEAKNKILSLGSKLISKTLEEDIYFQHPLRDFSKTDEALRLRGTNGKNYLTYKGAKISKISKTRLEIQTEIENFENTKEIFLKLGFKPVATISKKREKYILENTFIYMDEVKDLGYFIEIEEETENELSIKIIEEKLIKILEKINIPKKSITRKSYLELLLEKKKIT